MNYCPNCGAAITDELSEFCSNCGLALKRKSQNTTKVVKDENSIGYGVLGLCIPIVGLILFLVWKKDKPLSAKAAGIGALIGMVLNIIAAVVQVLLLGELDFY